MVLDGGDGNRPFGRAHLAGVWLGLAAVSAPLWIWQEGKYGLLKALFFALFFAYGYRTKRSVIDVAVFAFIMTAMQIFSRYVVNYHQLVVDADPAVLLPLVLHAALTLGSAWLMSWLFDLRGTPGPTYTRLAAFYMVFYSAEFILHATGVMLWRGLPLTLYHPLQFALLLAIPLLLWRLGAASLHFFTGRVPAFRAEAAWKSRFRDFENTRTVVFSSLALFALSVVWFGFAHFTVAKLGLLSHYEIASGCASDPAISAFLLHAWDAAFGLRDACLASGSMLSRVLDYLQLIASLFLALVLVQAVALALGAQKNDKPPKRAE